MNGLENKILKDFKEELYKAECPAIYLRDFLNKKSTDLLDKKIKEALYINTLKPLLISMVECSLQAYSKEDLLTALFNNQIAGQKPLSDYSNEEILENISYNLKYSNGFLEKKAISNEIAGLIFNKVEKYIRKDNAFYNLF